MKWLSFFLVAIGMSLDAYCQISSQKTAIINQIQEISPDETLVIDADTLVFGPNAELMILGTLNVRSPYIVFAPSAKLKGTGRICILSPASTEGMRFPEHMSTTIDGNGNLNMNVRVEVYNRAHLILGTVEHSFLKGLTLNSNDFYAGENVALMDDGVCVELKGNRFTLGTKAILEHSSSNRMVISGNDINSVFSKKIQANASYTFSIGLKKGDYSPVILKPEKEAELFVSLISHDLQNNKASFSSKNGGVNRIWGVHADHNVRAVYTFEHNIQDETVGMSSEDLEIFQYTDSKEWLLVSTNYLGDVRHSTQTKTSMYSNVARNYFSKFGKTKNGPQSQDDYITLQSGNSVVIPILENDRGGDGRLIVEKTRVVERPANGFVEILSKGEARYQPSLGFTGSDSFVYEVVDEFGIKSKSTVYITVEGENLFILSNVVTPNGDGYNDKLVFVWEDRSLELDLTIVNRWGDRLYQSKAYDNSWDGAGLSGGTYYYILKGKRQNGDDIHQKGWVLLSK